MPAEPEPLHVEAMLRDAARQRGEAFDAAGAGPATMPGPTRARLHEELARRFDAVSGRETASSGSGWARWWLALVGTAGVAAVVAFFTLASPKSPGPPLTVAVQVTPVESPPPAPVPVTATPAARTMPEIASAPTDPLLKDAAGESSKTRDGSSKVAGVLRAQTFTQTPLSVAAAPMKEIAFARRAAPPAPADAPAPGALGGAAATGQAASAPAATSSLLENFRFEQRGENVRVVDADGSVYTGQVEADKKTPAPRAENARPQAQAQAAATDKLSPSQDAGENFRFRATGDNRTLKKPVVFEGEYTEAANGAKLESKATNSQAVPNTEAQIRGRVRVLDGRDGQRAAEVDARAVGSAMPK